MKKKCCALRGKLPPVSWCLPETSKISGHLAAVIVGVINRKAPSTMSEAVALASSLPLPAPAGVAEESLRRLSSKRQSLNSTSSKNLTTQTSTDNVAPYQALPVQGPLISLNYTPALAVLEPDNMRKEVRDWQYHSRCVASHASPLHAFIMITQPSR